MGNLLIKIKISQMKFTVILAALSSASAARLTAGCMVVADLSSNKDAEADCSCDTSCALC